MIVDSFNKDTVSLQMRLWVPTAEYRTALRDLTEHAKLAVNKVLAEGDGGVAEVTEVADPHARQAGSAPQEAKGWRNSPQARGHARRCRVDIAGDRGQGETCSSNVAARSSKNWKPEALPVARIARPASSIARTTSGCRVSPRWPILAARSLAPISIASMPSMVPHAGMLAMACGVSI